MKHHFHAFAALLLVSTGYSEPAQPLSPVHNTGHAVITYAPKDHQLLQRLPSTMEGDVTYEAKLTGFDKGKLRITATSSAVPTVQTMVDVLESNSTTRVRSLSATLLAGLHAYHVELAYKEDTAPSWKVLDAAIDVVVGDAVLICGQSNGLQNGDCPSGPCPGGSPGFVITPTPSASDQAYVRTFGAIPWLECSANTAMILRGYNDRDWHTAQNQDPLLDGYVGSWPLAFAYRALAAEGIPIAILNGCRGGSSIERNQPVPPGTVDDAMVYQQLLDRYQASGLTGVKALFWHQGEFHRFTVASSDPCIDYGYVPEETVKSYQKSFAKLYQSWTSDYPGLEKVFVLQVRTERDYLTDPITNSMAGVFEAQRTMNVLDSMIVPQTTAGIALPSSGDIHFDRQGYEEVALNAYSAAAASLSDYSFSTAKSFSPVHPVQATRGTQGAETFIDIDFSINFFFALDPLVNDAATRARFLIPGATVDKVEVADYNTVRLTYSSSSPPKEVTYRLFGTDGPWIRCNNDNYAFGFTIAVN